jgi:hypothetical protein
MTDVLEQADALGPWVDSDEFNQYETGSPPAFVGWDQFYPLPIAYPVTGNATEMVILPCRSISPSAFYSPVPLAPGPCFSPVPITSGPCFSPGPISPTHVLMPVAPIGAPLISLHRAPVENIAWVLNICYKKRHVTGVRAQLGTPTGATGIADVRPLEHDREVPVGQEGCARSYYVPCTDDEPNLVLLLEVICSDYPDLTIETRQIDMGAGFADFVRRHWGTAAAVPANRTKWALGSPPPPSPPPAPPSIDACRFEETAGWAFDAEYRKYLCQTCHDGGTRYTNIDGYICLCLCSTCCSRLATLRPPCRCGTTLFVHENGFVSSMCRACMAKKAARSREGASTGHGRRRGKDRKR